MIGFFSAKQKHFYGSILYLTPSGEQVEVTEVTLVPNYNHSWSDSICVGKVDQFISKGESGALSEEFTPLTGEESREEAIQQMSSFNDYLKRVVSEEETLKFIGEWQ